MDELESPVQEVVDQFLSQLEEILVQLEPLPRMAKDWRALCFRYVCKAKQQKTLDYKNATEVCNNF